MLADDAVKSNITLQDAVALGATDAEFYCRVWFPRTVRQPFAPMHHATWNLLESSFRLVNILMHRGAGKTSHCRMYTSKSIAYGLSRTITYVGKSESHAIRSTNWLKKQVEENENWTRAFNIRKGGKWQDVEFEIMVGDTPCWVMANGINGSIRGINRDDYRPDLIVLDDVLDDENAHTVDQREKTERLVFGALAESLAPEVDAPHAKMIALNTPQNREDFSVKALKDPSWASAVFGCWSKETQDLPTEYQQSAWPERYPTAVLQKEKRDAVNRNLVSTFLREKECKLVSPETSAFKLPWLRKYGLAPEKPICVYAIDPVPPPSDANVAKGRVTTDFEAHAVWGAVGHKRFLLDYRLKRGHNPTWTISTFFELQKKYTPIVTLVETVQYQRVLMWILRKAMDAAQSWHVIEEFQSRESKYTRIVNAINRPASAGHLYVRAEHTDFVQQFATYPEVANDDLLDASAIALMKLQNLFIAQDGKISAISDNDFDPLAIDIYGCP